MDSLFETNVGSLAVSSDVVFVNHMSIDTAPDTPVFYSGPGNRALAEQYAAANGGSTIETTNAH